MASYLKELEKNQATSNFTDPGFWNSFVENNWEKKVFASNNVFKTPPIDEDLFFNTVLKCVEDYDAISFRFYIGTKAQKIGPGYEFLPKPEDKSFQGYNERVSGILGDKKYCLVLNYLEVVDFGLWEWSREFLSGLYEKIGFNKLGNYNALFVGNYDKTPFGVHLDPESVFHIPIVGKKVMMTWPNAYSAKEPGIVGAHDYQAFLGGATKLEASPGGFLYWPSESWHISEKADDFSVSLALSLHCVHNVVPQLLSKIDTFAKRMDGLNTGTAIPFNPHNMMDSAASLPDDLSNAVNFIQHVASETALRCEWIKLVTGYNFPNPPKPEPLDNSSISGNSVIAGNSKYPIVYVKLGDNLAVSANGHLITRDYSECLTRMLTEINQGNVIDVASLIDRFQELETGNILDLLRWLKSVRAVSVV
jgi:hypothetical protein